ncbi:MAG: hypothetical protein HC806_01310 [Anaerolineae bacterium]|nr:hypothetical protein [Anaerolineae bacterium]
MKRFTLQSATGIGVSWRFDNVFRPRGGGRYAGSGTSPGMGMVGARKEIRSGIMAGAERRMITIRVLLGGKHAVLPRNKPSGVFHAIQNHHRTFPH